MSSLLCSIDLADIYTTLAPCLYDYDQVMETPYFRGNFLLDRNNYNLCLFNKRLDIETYEYYNVNIDKNIVIYKCNLNNYMGYQIKKGINYKLYN